MRIIAAALIACAASCWTGEAPLKRPERAKEATSSQLRVEAADNCRLRLDQVLPDLIPQRPITSCYMSGDIYFCLWLKEIEYSDALLLWLMRERFECHYHD